LGLLGIAGVAGFWYYRKQVTVLQDSLDFKIIGFRLGDLTGAVSQVFLTLRIFSKSTLDADIQEVFADVYLDNMKIGNVQNLDKFILPAKGYSDVKLIVTFSPKQILADVVKLANSYLITKDLSIKAKGYIKIKLGGMFNITVPFDYATTMKEIQQG
jgi:LEA14-like dessication related protein